MTAQVMHRNQRARPDHKPAPLQKADPRQQRADQARRVRNGDALYVRQAQARLLKRLLRDRRNLLHMLSGGDFRHDAAVLRVQRHLGIYDV